MCSASPARRTSGLVEALSASSIRYVLVRHEQAASFMAEVYGRLTGAAGVCSATLGPGAINLLLGVADATTNSTPVVALSAQVGTRRMFKESHQGVDLVPMFRPVTKWSELVATREAVPEMIRKAFKLAQTERPGAVYLGGSRGRRDCAGAGRRSAARGQPSAPGRAVGEPAGAGRRRLEPRPEPHRARRPWGRPGGSEPRSAPVRREARGTSCDHVPR